MSIFRQRKRSPEHRMALPFTASASSIDASSYRETTYQGLVRIEGSDIVLEYQESVVEMGAGGYTEEDGKAVTEVRIPAEAVRTLTFHNRRVRAPALDIELARLGPAARLPWSKDTRIRLKIPRRERDAARDLATDFRLLQADSRLRELGEGDLAE